MWLWADSRQTGYELLQQLCNQLGDKAERLVKTHHTLYLRGGGRVHGMIPKDRPDGDKHIAVWMATLPIPQNYTWRLTKLGQCEEFWALPGTVDGSDWRKKDGT